MLCGADTIDGLKYSENFTNALIVEENSRWLIIRLLRIRYRGIVKDLTVKGIRLGCICAVFQSIKAKTTKILKIFSTTCICTQRESTLYNV